MCILRLFSYRSQHYFTNATTATENMPETHGNKIRDVIRNNIGNKMRHNKALTTIRNRMRNSTRTTSATSSLSVQSTSGALSKRSATPGPDPSIPAENGACYWNRLSPELCDEIFEYAYGRPADIVKIIVKSEVDEYNKYEKMECDEKGKSFEVSRLVSGTSSA
jgi:hypothetical protein